MLDILMAFKAMSLEGIAKEMNPRGGTATTKGAQGGRQ